MLYVPVDTGFLKKSGGVNYLNNGIEIFYVTKYARRVEFGGPAIPYTGDQTVHVKERRRKDGTIVAAHDVVYHNARLVRFRPKITKFERGEPIWRVLKEEPAREGQYYLTRALHEGLKRLAEDLGFCLRHLDLVRIRKG